MFSDEPTDEDTFFLRRIESYERGEVPGTLFSAQDVEEGNARLAKLLARVEQVEKPCPFAVAIDVWANRTVRSKKDGQTNPEYHPALQAVRDQIERYARRNRLLIYEERVGRGKAFGFQPARQ